LNRAGLQEQLEQALRRVNEKQNQHQEVSEDTTANGRTSRIWRMRDRLTDEDVCQLIERSRAGVTARVLAEEFKISHSSVKTVLREHRARRKDRS
jgi:response regulator of citrate/malate metabolism